MKRTTKLTRAGILKLLHEHEAMLRRYSVRRIGLFGSYVRNRPRRGSDVDFLVEFNAPTYDNFYDLSVSLERLLRRRIELVTEGSLSPHLRPFVEEEVAWHEVQ
ncbi:MAG: nucleotidyltransferase domain-containing protein [Acidobacteria bacterium]|nr:nucleotidyltransferase domain-containing protein [Acidobacteriota bacterium]